MLRTYSAEEAPSPKKLPFSTEKLSGLFEQRHIEDVEAHKLAIGRDLADTEGESTAYCRSAKRVAEILLFYLCCGCLLERMDKHYCEVTGNKPIISANKRSLPGVSHLSTNFLNTSLTRREADQTDNIYYGFMNRYYKQCNIWAVVFHMNRLDPASEEFQRYEAAFYSKSELMKGLLFIDSVDRRKREDKTTKYIVNLGLFISVVTVGIALVDANLEQNEQHDRRRNIAYAQMAIGASATVIIKIIDSFKSEASKAAQNFDNLHQWACKEIEKFHTHIKNLKRRRSRGSESIGSHEAHGEFFNNKFVELALIDKGFIPYSTEFHEKKLVYALSELRMLQGFKRETPEVLMRNLMIYRNQHKLENNPLNQAQRKSRTSIEKALLTDFSKLLNAPICLINEQLTHGSYLNIFYFPEVSSADEATQLHQDDEDEEEQETKSDASELLKNTIFEQKPPPVFPENYLVLYSPIVGEYLPVSLPTGDEKRPLYSDIQSQLSAINQSFLKVAGQEPNALLSFSIDV